MGGVDQLDMMLALYPSKCRFRKWYHQVVFHIVSQRAVNVWVIYRELGGQENCVETLSETASPGVCNFM